MKKWATNDVTGLKGSCFTFVGPRFKRFHGPETTNTQD